MELFVTELIVKSSAATTAAGLHEPCVAVRQPTPQVSLHPPAMLFALYLESFHLLPDRWLQLLASRKKSNGIPMPTRIVNLVIAFMF
jgi:hypothetical protein